MRLDDEAIARMYKEAKTIAIVGASSKPGRDSFDAVGYLIEQGYDVVPVNPRETEVHGAPAVASLSELDGPPDVVVVFRNADDAAGVAREAVAAGAKVVWLPLGVTSEEAGAVTDEAGAGYVEDRCPRATHRLMKSAGMLG